MLGRDVADRGATILIIDDEMAVRRVVKKFLVKGGYRVVTASNAMTGLELLVKVKPDLILLDMRMKGLSGAGFMNRITNSDGTLSCPVLVITGYTEMEDLFGDVPVDGFMTKPVEYTSLLAEVSRILAKSGVDKQEQRGRARSRVRVIVADDDELSLRTLTRHFEAAGFSVHAVASGNDAIAKAVESMPDAVVVRDIMKEMNGSKVASILKSMPKMQGIPVVLYSEWGSAKRFNAETAYVSASSDEPVIQSTHPSEIPAAVKTLLSD